MMSSCLQFDVKFSLRLRVNKNTIRYIQTLRLRIIFSLVDLINLVSLAQGVPGKCTIYLFNLNVINLTEICGAMYSLN